MISIYSHCLAAIQAHRNGPVLDDEILGDDEVVHAIETEGIVHRSYEILNTDRATLGRVGGRIAKLHGDSGFAGTVSIDLKVSNDVHITKPPFLQVLN